MKQLSLDNLRTLVTIVEQGGFAKAGELLGRAQPTISLQVKKLEQQLGTRLFNKVGQRQVANLNGMHLYQQAKAMLAINDEVFRHYEQSTLSGRLRLGIPSEFASTLLPGIIGEFSQLYPDVTLEVTSALSKQLLSGDNLSHLDLVLALVTGDMPKPAQLVLEDRLVWVGDKQKPLPENKIALVLAPQGCVYRSRVIETLKQRPIKWRITYTNADLYGLIAAIKQGLGITALASSSVPPDLNILRNQSLPYLGKVKICLFNQGTAHPQISHKLTEFIRERLGSVG